MSRMAVIGHGESQFGAGILLGMLAGRREVRMATAQDFRRIALSLEGTTSAPHFERTAFKVARIYATLAPDGLTANLGLSPDEQELKCLLAPDAFQPVPNAWGKQGWTTAQLAELSLAELKNALELAWRHSLPRKRERRTSPLR